MTRSLARSMLSLDITPLIHECPGKSRRLQNPTRARPAILEQESRRAQFDPFGQFRGSMQIPIIETGRLILRPFRIEDAPDVQRLAGDWSIADTTLNVPHPYEDGMAEEWIATHEPKFASRELATFAITLRKDEQLIGALSLKICQELDMAELGYWIAKPFWNRGFCTEAAIAAIRYGFDGLGLNRVHANHLARNPASGRVMEKAGLIREGVARQHTKKWGKHEDLVLYGLVRDDWERGKPQKS